MGVPNAAVSVVSKIMYKNLGISNEDIVLYTSLMYLPWVLKPVWAPFMEPYLTKRRWVLGMEFLMAVTIGLVALVLPLPGFFRLSLALFWIAGFSSGTQDIAADAIYLTTLPPKEQAKYTGIQGICWNCGSILAAGPLVMLTGILHRAYGYSWAHTWMLVMALLGATMAGLGFWHLWALPEGKPSSLHGGGLAGAWIALKASWVSFFQKECIGMMLVVVFMYRFGEGFIENFGQLFLMDPRSAGGLGFDNVAIGTIYNTYGTIGFLAGALLGGLFSARFTLRRSFIFLAVALNVPHVTYYYLSHAMPDNMAIVSLIVTIEKFGFGFGSVGHMLYMMQQIAPGPFQMTHYAFATGVMAFTKMATGSMSKYLYLFCGRHYPTFFLFVLLASIPPIICACFAPFPQRTNGEAPA
jgi:PAT family beta-lactamase induction signal transducer AmpG